MFAPDGVSTAQLLSDLVADLCAQGHRVSVVTTQPHYNRDKAAEAAQPLTRRRGGLFFESQYLGARVIHTRMSQRRGGFVVRLGSLALFHPLALIASLFLVERPNIILVPSPLLTAGVLGWLIARLKGGALVYNVQELYPDIAVKMGQLTNPLVGRFLGVLERFVYRRARVTTVISEGMRRIVSARGGPTCRVVLIPNFVDVDVMCPGPRDNEFRREHALEDRFVVSYAGNMGFAQGMEVILQVADLLRERADIRFLFVGDGALRDELVLQASARSLSNVQFVTHQPYVRVPEIYAASDLCIVTMVGNIAAEGVPSKFIRIMACGRPVLGIAASESDLACEICASGGGVVVSPSSPGAIKEAILMFRNSPELCRTVGEAGRTYASKWYARHAVTSRYAELFREIAPAVQASRTA